jgi:hypothetical protein
VASSASREESEEFRCFFGPKDFFKKQIKAEENKRGGKT